MLLIFIWHDCTHLIVYVIICVGRRIMVQSMGAKSKMVEIHLIHLKFGFLRAIGYYSSSSPFFLLKIHNQKQK